MNLIEKHEKEFNIYYNFLVEENEKYNLTSITEKKEVYIKHFMDSLSMSEMKNMEEVNSICDVGSGAGFPSIPLKICFPHLQVTIIEPTLKRINFLKQLLEKLNINDVVLINARSEDVAKDYEEKFDICTARAVANMPVLLELLVKFVKINKDIILYKGSKAIEEIEEAKNALNLLNCQVNQTYFYELDDDFGSRCLIDITKKKSTNTIYPRRYSEIKKKPL